MLEQKIPIWNASQVTKWVNFQNDINLKDRFVCEIFKKEMDLKYSKIKKLAPGSNSEKNLVLRQQYALQMLKILDENAIIYNADESWLSNFNLSRMKWAPKHQSNSLEEFPANPRISIIATIDNFGN